MIILKNYQQIQIMREAGAIAATALQLAGDQVKVGVSTKEIDDVVRQYIFSMGATPSFLGYSGFPASSCISVNQEVIHGIPSANRLLQEGDIVSVDVGAEYRGYHGDNAATFAVGTITKEAQQLLTVTQQCLQHGIAAAVIGNRVGDIGHAIESHAKQFSYGVVTKFVGHGIGKRLHEDPQLPNVGPPGRRERLAAGMTIAIEPMITLSGGDVEVLSDGWTVLTRNGCLAAHFEHVVAITADGPEILTIPRKEFAPHESA